MKIAILSGKGGTGKTFISVNLAHINKDSIYIDCDTEEPNGHLYFKSKREKKIPVNVKIPTCDQDLCDGCLECVNFCRYNALAYANNKWILFDKICHWCGACTIVCPKKALTEVDKSIGYYSHEKVDQTYIRSGFLNPTEVSGIPIIQELLNEDNFKNKVDTIKFIDCPPGSSCAVIESVKGADFALLVAEPSTFGSHNLEMVHNLVKLYNIPYGALLNKVTKGENPSYDYCSKNKIPILASIDFDPNLAYINSQGLIAAKEDPRYFKTFENLWESILKEVAK